MNSRDTPKKRVTFGIIVYVSFFTAGAPCGYLGSILAVDDSLRLLLITIAGRRAWRSFQRSCGRLIAKTQAGA